MQKATLQLSVRLTLLLAAVCMVFLMIGGSADAEGPTPSVSEYVVAPGDTLWGIAAGRTESGGDIRRLISDISELSGVENGMIFPGQILLLPEG